MLPCVCSVNRSQRTSKCGKNISDTLGYRLVCHFFVLTNRNRYDARWISKTKSQNTRKWRNGGIINPLFDGLTYNTSGHFAHCTSQNIRAYYIFNHRIKFMIQLFLDHTQNFQLAFYQHSLLNLIDVKIKPVHFWGQD